MSHVASIYSIDEAAKNARASSSSRGRKSKAQSCHEPLAHRQAGVKGQTVFLVQAPCNTLNGYPSKARLLRPLAEYVSYRYGGSRSCEHADGRCRCRCRRRCGWRWNVSMIAGSPRQFTPHWSSYICDPAWPVRVRVAHGLEPWLRMLRSNRVFWKSIQGHHQELICPGLLNSRRITGV
ncbi:hypothetical protein BDV11DRAFT_196833 [Aspergillus similis]